MKTIYYTRRGRPLEHWEGWYPHLDYYLIVSHGETPMEVLLEYRGSTIESLEDALEWVEKMPTDYPEGTWDIYKLRFSEKIADDYEFTVRPKFKKVR